MFMFKDQNFLDFVISVPNFLTIFNVVFGDISVNLHSIRLLLDLLYSKYLQQYFLVILLRPSQFLSYLSSTVTNIHDIFVIPCSTSSFSSPTYITHIPALNKNSSSSIVVCRNSYSSQHPSEYFFHIKVTYSIKVDFGLIGRN